MGSSAPGPAPPAQGAAAPPAKGAAVATDSAAASALPRLPPVPYRQLFRYATPLDMALMGLALVCAAGSGIIMPCFSLLFGDILNAINSGSATSGFDTFVAVVNVTALRFMLLGIGTLVFTYISIALPMYTSERQLRHIRERYMGALLRQDQGYVETHRTGEAATRMAEETLAVQEGIGEKVAQTATYFSTFIAGIVIAFTLSWKMTLVMMAFLPLLAMLGSFMKRVFGDMVRAIGWRGRTVS